MCRSRSHICLSPCETQSQLLFNRLRSRLEAYSLRSAFHLRSHQSWGNYYECDRSTCYGFAERGLRRCRISPCRTHQNHKAVELGPIVIRYFTLTEGVSVKILTVTSHQIEGWMSHLAVTQSSMASLHLASWIKCFGFVLTTQTPVLVERQEEKTMCFTNLIKPPPAVWLEYDVLHTCSVHNAHTMCTMQCNQQQTHFPVNFVVKVFGYFHIYIVWTEELKEFCDFVATERATLLGTSRTRWRSLGPAVERVLKLSPSTSVLLQISGQSFQYLE